MFVPGNQLNDGGLFREHRDTWLEAIRAGLAKKRDVYAKGAEECQRFVLGEHKYLFEPKYITDQMYLQVGANVGPAGRDNKPIRMPYWRISDNWVAKFVQIMTPYLTQGQVVRTVKAKKPFIPPPITYGIDPPELQAMKFNDKNFMAANPGYVMQQQMAMQQYQMDVMQANMQFMMRDTRSTMLQEMLNYSVQELNLMKDRRAIVEDALMYGFAAFNTELVQMPGTNSFLVGSNYILANDIVWDPDTMTEKDAKWLAVQCRATAWQFSKLYGTPEDQIKPNQRSTVSEAFYQKLVIDEGGAGNTRHRDNPLDEVVYWKVWSRMGSGARMQLRDKRRPEMEALDAELGDYCFFIVTDSVDYCANMSPMLLEQAMSLQNMANSGQPQIDPGTGKPINPLDLLRQSTQWPTPYYLDIDDPWPITTLYFHRRNGSPYPIPHFEFALSYLKFMVWVVSFVADKCYRSMRDIWIIDKQIGEQLKEAIENGDDECIVTLKDMDQKTIKQFCDLISAPELKSSIMEVYQFFEAKVEQMTGLTDLMQAQLARSLRTATEAQVVSDASQLRPRDMAQRVNETDTRVARKESVAALLHYQPQDIAPILGVPGANAWQRITQGQDIISVLRESDLDVIASQGRILDLNTRVDQSNKMAQLVLPMLIQMGQATGVFGPANRVLREIAEANQIDPELMAAFPDMPPPQPAPAKGVASAPSQKNPSQGPQ